MKVMYAIRYSVTSVTHEFVIVNSVLANTSYATKIPIKKVATPTDRPVMSTSVRTLPCFLDALPSDTISIFTPLRNPTRSSRHIPHRLFLVDGKHTVQHRGGGWFVFLRS